MEARSAREIWEATLGELQIQVSKPNYRTWLENTIGLSYRDNQFVVGAPNTFVAEYLNHSQRSLIEKTLIGLTQPNINVFFQVDTNQPGSPGDDGSGGVLPTTQSAGCPGLNPKYTFDSFVVGSSNRLAHAAALGIAENPGQSYNPLFIYGGVGLGKTHLLHAIGHVAQANHTKVLYVSAEQFTNELTLSLRERKVAEFRSKYRSVDLLLIDDIQFFGGKEQTEENFFHTFNTLHNANHQIVISSDCSPKSIPLLQERLRSRFEWGLLADIQPPDFETRLAILQTKAQPYKINASLAVLEYLARQVHQNIRELEGCLNRVMAYARLLRAPITTELATQALNNIASKADKSPPLTPDQIIEVVASHFEVSPPALKSPRRDKPTLLARQVAMYLLKQENKYSLEQIGQYLGKRNPSTVMHSLGKITGIINNDPYLRRKIQNIRQSLLTEPNTSNTQ